LLGPAPPPPQAAFIIEGFTNPIAPVAGVKRMGEVGLLSFNGNKAAN